MSTQPINPDPELDPDRDPDLEPIHEPEPLVNPDQPDQPEE